MIPCGPSLKANFLSSARSAAALVTPSHIFWSGPLTVHYFTVIGVAYWRLKHFNALSISLFTLGALISLYTSYHILQRCRHQEELPEAARLVVDAEAGYARNYSIKDP